jgi:hypothetical protein
VMKTGGRESCRRVGSVGLREEKSCDDKEASQHTKSLRFSLIRRQREYFYSPANGFQLGFYSAALAALRAVS